MENNFYVYMYLRDDGTPYYVGRGKGNRAFHYHKVTKKPKEISKIVITHKNLTFQESNDLEKELIKKYGRKDIGTGILRNMTDGGEGALNLSEETRKKISEKAKINFAKEKNPMYGKKHSDSSKELMSTNNPAKRGEVKKKISEFAKTRVGSKNSFYGKTHTEEYKKYMSENNPMHDPEVCKRVSEKLKGRTITEEQRAKISDTLNRRYSSGEIKAVKPFLGKTHTEEYKKYMSEKMKGRVVSEETRRKLSESRKEYYRKKTLEKFENVSGAPENKK